MINPKELGKTLNTALELLADDDQRKWWLARYAETGNGFSVGDILEYVTDKVPEKDRKWNRGRFVVYYVRNDGRVFGTGIDNDHQGYIEVEQMRRVPREEYKLIIAAGAKLKGVPEREAPPISHAKDEPCTKDGQQCGTYGDVKGTFADTKGTFAEKPADLVLDGNGGTRSVRAGTWEQVIADCN